MEDFLTLRSVLLRYPRSKTALAYSFSIVEGLIVGPMDFCSFGAASSWCDLCVTLEAGLYLFVRLIWLVLGSLVASIAMC